MKKLAYSAALALTSMSVMACASNPATHKPTTPAIPTTSHSTTKTVKKEAGVWIDVRSAEEYAQGHLQGALNITHDTLASRIKAIEPNKNAPIHLYCRSGRRAEVARKTLLDMGYTNVTNHGGYQALYDKGYR